MRRTEGCWWWTASCLKEAKQRYPYGQFALRYRGRFYNLKAHRVAWLLTFGPISDGLCVLHRCDNPKCVNPNHLFLGTQGDNVRDGFAKGRYPKVRTSKLTPAQRQEIVAAVQQGASKTQLAGRYRVSLPYIGLLVKRLQGPLQFPSPHPKQPDRHFDLARELGEV